MSLVYAVLCVIGLVVPYTLLAPWLQQHGLVLPRLVSEAFAAPVSAFAWADVVVSAVALLCFMAHEQSRRRVRHLWAPVVALVTVGVSLALPLYLLLRESAPGPRPHAGDAAVR